MQISLKIGKSMQCKNNITTLILALAVILTGCSNKQDAISEALRYDRTISEQTGSRASLWEMFAGLSDEKKADYVRNLKRVPLGGCPKDFKEAYQRHITAWESRSSSAISSTWADVLAVARLHGVTWQ
jgi:uncharacterized lipoprotein NlpE involved in copper resistance